MEQLKLGWGENLFRSVKINGKTYSDVYRFEGLNHASSTQFSGLYDREYGFIRMRKSINDSMIYKLELLP